MDLTTSHSAERVFRSWFDWLTTNGQGQMRNQLVPFALSLSKGKGEVEGTLEAKDED
jgi:hypothetical protein